MRLTVLCSLLQRRAADACGDPSASVVFVQGLNPGTTAHALRPRWVFVASDTGGSPFAIQGEIFRAWDLQTAQPGTVPFYQLQPPAPGGGTDIIYLPQMNGGFPSAPGFGTAAATDIVGYAYPTQICNSIPLFVVYQPTFTYHWYTTSTAERNSLITNVWVDGGVVAFVLPVNGTCFSATLPATHSDIPLRFRLCLQFVMYQDPPRYLPYFLSYLIRPSTCSSFPVILSLHDTPISSQLVSCSLLLAYPLLVY